MLFATLLRYFNVNEGTVWDKRVGIPHFLHIMAEKYGVGLCAVMNEYDFHNVCEVCDGLIIPGSSNHINPKHWGGAPFDEKELDDEFLLDSKLINYFIENNKPIFGICGGLQAINVTLGGSLKTVERHNEDLDRFHKIHIHKNNFVYDAFGTEEATVNTYHCWAIDKLGEGLKVAAISEDGVIEAIECREKNIFATQWHPEISMLEESAVEHKLFSDFIEICG